MEDVDIAKNDYLIGEFVSKDGYECYILVPDLRKGLSGCPKDASFHVKIDPVFRYF